MRYSISGAENTRRLIKPGVYEVTIESADLRTSSQGNEMIVLRLKLTDEGTIVYDQVVFSPNAKWKVKAFLECFDIPAEDGEDESITIDDDFADDLIGKTGTVRIGVEPYNGIKRNRVHKYLPMDEEQVESDE